MEHQLEETPLLHSPRSERYPPSGRLHEPLHLDDNDEPAENTGVTTEGEQQIEEQFSPYIAAIREIGSPRSVGPSGSDENRRPTGGRGELTDFDREIIEMQESNFGKVPVDSKLASRHVSGGDVMDKGESGTAAQGRAPAEGTAAELGRVPSPFSRREQDGEHVGSYSPFNRSPPDDQLDQTSEIDQVSDTASYDSAERQAAAEAAARNMLAPLPGQRAPWQRPPIRERVVRPAAADDVVEDEPVEGPPVEDESLTDQSIHEADAEPSELIPEFQAMLDQIRAIGNPAIPPDFGRAPVVDDPVPDDPAAEQPAAHDPVTRAGPAPPTDYLSTLAGHDGINAIDSPSVESAEREPPNIFSPTSAAVGGPWIIRPPGTFSVAIARPAPIVTSTAYAA
ncbi:hypothetical protein LTR95_013451 [Oleoguttula sp. CCFEE 5521]